MPGCPGLGARGHPPGKEALRKIGKPWLTGRLTVRGQCTARSMHDPDWDCAAPAVPALPLRMRDTTGTASDMPPAAKLSRWAGNLALQRQTRWAGELTPKCRAAQKPSHPQRFSRTPDTPSQSRAVRDPVVAATQAGPWRTRPVPLIDSFRCNRTAVELCRESQYRPSGRFLAGIGSPSSV